MRDRKPYDEDFEPDEIDRENCDEPPERRERQAGGSFLSWKSLALGVLLGVWLGGDGGD